MPRGPRSIASQCADGRGEKMTCRIQNSCHRRGPFARRRSAKAFAASGYEPLGSGCQRAIVRADRALRPSKLLEVVDRPDSAANRHHSRSIAESPGCPNGRLGPEPLGFEILSPTCGGKRLGGISRPALRLPGDSPVRSPGQGVAHLPREQELPRPFRPPSLRAIDPRGDEMR